MYHSVLRSYLGAMDDCVVDQVDFLSENPEHIRAKVAPRDPTKPHLYVSTLSPEPIQSCAFPRIIIDLPIRQLGIGDA